MAKPSRSSSYVWLIGYPTESITGSRLPSGREVMTNFIYFHRAKKLSINDSAVQVYNNIVPFWEKSRLPMRPKQHILKKIKDLYIKQVGLVRNRKRNNAKDQENQRMYAENLDRLFDISHANSEQLIKNEEDRQFLKLQKESRTGCIGSLDRKLYVREKRSAERQKKFAKRLKEAATFQNSFAISNAPSTSIKDETEAESSNSKEDSDDEYTEKVTPKRKFLYEKDAYKDEQSRRSVITPKVVSVLDRNNISIRKSTMLLASVLNMAGEGEACFSKSNETLKNVVLSKSTVHRERQRLRSETAQQIKIEFNASKSVVHWDGKLLLDLSSNETRKVDRLPVLVTSLKDSSTKLLGIPKLLSGTGEKAANAVFELLQSWKCHSQVIGMCFDTTFSNTGKLKGACVLLEKKIGRSLLWLACRHHMLEVLLSDTFTVCFGHSSGPEIIMFKRFREKWVDLNHHNPNCPKTPLIVASDILKNFVADQLQTASKNFPRDDYRELLNLSALMIGIYTNNVIRKPGALHRARWMAKAIYSLKIELLFDGNETIMQLTPKEFQGIQRFNRFVVCVYIQSWYTCQSTVDAPVNDILLIQRLNEYDDIQLRKTGLNMILRHSWYLSEELATLCLFSKLLTTEEKCMLLTKISEKKNMHLLKKLPSKISDLSISRSFFRTAQIEDSFLSVPVEKWHETKSFQEAEAIVRNMPCVNDCAERGIALIETFNDVTKDEEQKQYLLQVVEMHRKKFGKCNREELKDM